MPNYNKILGLLLSAGKAFFNAIVSITWGIASFFLMIALLTYYKLDPSTIASLLPIIAFIQKQWGWFFVSIFFYDFLTSYKDFVNKITEEPVALLKNGKKPENKL